MTADSAKICALAPTRRPGARSARCRCRNRGLHGVRAPM